MLKHINFETIVIGIDKPNFLDESKKKNFILVTTENSVEKISIDSSFTKEDILDKSFFKQDERIIRVVSKENINAIFVFILILLLINSIIDIPRVE